MYKHLIMKLITILCLICITLGSSDHYFNSEEYMRKSGKEKLELLLNDIYKDKEPQGYFSIIESLRLLFQRNMPTFKWTGDVIPDGRKKLIHSEGVVAPCVISFDAKNKKYTGLFASKLEHSLIRFSTAQGANTKKSSPEGAYDNFVPGIALKVLVDGDKSQNLVAMFDTVGQNSWNFFKHDFSNNFDINKDTPFKLLAVAAKFRLITNFISAVGAKEWAEVNPDGTKVDESKAKFPFQLYFVPTAEVKALFQDNFTEDYKSILSRLEEGTKIYTIEATEKPGCAREEIGSITLAGKPTTSKFGDRELFFRHGLIDKDDSFSGHEDFSNYRDSFRILGRKEKSDPAGKFSCPFSHAMKRHSK